MEAVRMFLEEDEDEEVSTTSELTAGELVMAGDRDSAGEGTWEEVAEAIGEDSSSEEEGAGADEVGSTSVCAAAASKDEE
uniref:Uncharacterized protein n=1 Tax=Candidozyma auris TaxID=498019 RepID=A0A0L0NNJ5_CANAR